MPVCPDQRTDQEEVRCHSDVLQRAGDATGVTLQQHNACDDSESDCRILCTTYSCQYGDVSQYKKYIIQHYLFDVWNLKVWWSMPTC
jgi:hypothetical protein